MLKEGGADPSIANYARYTPKWAACRGGYTDIARALDDATERQGKRANDGRGQSGGGAVDEESGWSSGGE